MPRVLLVMEAVDATAATTSAAAIVLRTLKLRSHIFVVHTLKSLLFLSICRRRHMVSTKLATHDKKPARKELKGKVPTSSIYRNYKANDANKITFSVSSYDKDRWVQKITEQTDREG